MLHLALVVAAWTAPAPMRQLAPARAGRVQLLLPQFDQKPADAPADDRNALEKLFRRPGGVSSVSPAAAAAPAAEQEEKLSIQQLLAQYGVIALLFHFTVWVTTITTVYGVLSSGLDVSSLLPAELTGGAAAEMGAAAGTAAATFAIVEGPLGPPRLALTITATPAVSRKARQFKVVRDVEAFALNAWAKVTGGDQ